MPFKQTKQLAHKNKQTRMDPGASTSSPQNQHPFAPPRIPCRLSPEDRAALERVFPNSLYLMLKNENVRIGELIDNALRIIQWARKDDINREDDIDWEELERNSSNETEELERSSSFRLLKSSARHLSHLRKNKH